MSEAEFLNELARRSGCGILLDINNAYVSAKNLEFDAGRYIAGIDPTHVEEIHLAGHSIDRFESIEIRIDNHGSRICDAVRALYARFVERAGPRARRMRCRCSEVCENVLSLMLISGLLSRASALGLLVMTAVIQFFVFPDQLFEANRNWSMDLLWAAPLLVVFARGPGALSIDASVPKR